MSSSELKITMANLQEAIQCASVDILEPLHTAQMMSGCTKMEAVQELYCITVSIPNIFIDTQLIINNFHRRNGLPPPPYGGSWAYQMRRSTHSFQSCTPCFVSAQSWVWWSIILLLVQSWTQNTLVMSTLQWSTSKVWQRSTYIIIKVCNKYIALFLSSYNLLTGNSTDPIALPPHHVTPALIETPPLLRSTCLFKWPATSPQNIQSPWNHWIAS